MSLNAEIYLIQAAFWLEILKKKKKKKKKQLLAFPVTINNVPNATKVQLKLNLFAAHTLKNKGQKRKQGQLSGYELLTNPFSSISRSAKHHV